MTGRVLTNDELDAIEREPWTVHLHNYDDVARTLSVLRRSAKAWHRAHEIATTKPTVADGARGMERG